MSAPRTPDWNPCAVVPVYNHGKTAGPVAAELVAAGLPVILVDDGSGEETKRLLAEAARGIAGVTLHTLPANLGKGGAVAHGLERAFEAGFSHALQVDADGQHDLGEVLHFLGEARARPELLIAGRPVYDASVPTARLVGRRITNFFVAVETLSRDIPDAMCGFRVYPLAATHRLLVRRRLSRRMEFDIEVLVRLHWQGLRMRFMPVKVVYPEGGISNFRVVKDNIAISGIHTLLCLGMLVRLPYLLWRRAGRA